MYNEAVMNKRQKFKIYWQFSEDSETMRLALFFGRHRLQRSTNDEGLWQTTAEGKASPAAIIYI